MEFAKAILKENQLDRPVTLISQDNQS